MSRPSRWALPVSLLRVRTITVPCRAATEFPQLSGLRIGAGVAPKAHHVVISSLDSLESLTIGPESFNKAAEVYLMNCKARPPPNTR